MAGTEVQTTDLKQKSPIQAGNLAGVHISWVYVPDFGMEFLNVLTSVFKESDEKTASPFR